MKSIQKLVLVMCVVIIFTNNLEAQVRVGGLQEYINYSNIDNAYDRINNPYSDFRGSPFLTEEFEKGQIKLIDEKVYKGELRYNIYADQIEFKTSDDNIYAVKNPEMVKGVSIGSQTFVCLNKDAGESMDGVYEVLVEGDFVLIEKHVVVLKDAKPAQPYIEAKPATFHAKKSRYLILNNEGEYVEILAKKDLLTIDTKKLKDVEVFVKKNKTKASKKEDLVEFTNFLNQ